MSIIRNPSLAPDGRRKIAWAEGHMPVLARIRQDLEKERPFQGMRLALCLHLEAKTAVLALTLKAGGGEVRICGSNPLSTQDDVAAALAERGVGVFAWRGTTSEEYNDFLQKTVENEPHLLIDDGGDVTQLLHTTGTQWAGHCLGGCEETTTGVNRLRAMEKEGALRFPMVAVNDARMKHLFDNRYGTGQSTWDGIMRNTNLLMAGKRVVVLGYGMCGKGVAMRAKGLGANVIVCEADPVRACEALLEGMEVMPSLEAARVGEIFVTVTGCHGILTEEHFAAMNDGALLANAGHFDVEIDVAALGRMAQTHREVRPNVSEYRLPPDKSLFLLAEGRLVNLAAGDGHPVEIMDLSFALQTLGVLHVREQGASLGKRVVTIGEDMDRRVAELFLESRGLRIDHLTPEQVAYLNSWRLEG